jgi:hypothetical protein
MSSVRRTSFGETLPYFVFPDGCDTAIRGSGRDLWAATDHVVFGLSGRGRSYEADWHPDDRGRDHLGLFSTFLSIR